MNNKKTFGWLPVDHTDKVTREKQMKTNLLFCSLSLSLNSGNMESRRVRVLWFQAVVANDTRRVQCCGLEGQGSYCPLLSQPNQRMRLTRQTQPTRHAGPLHNTIVSNMSLKQEGQLDKTQINKYSVYTIFLKRWPLCFAKKRHLFGLAFVGSLSEVLFCRLPLNNLHICCV